MSILHYKNQKCHNSDAAGNVHYLKAESTHCWYRNNGSN